MSDTQNIKDFVPGCMRCAKCNFRLQRVNLYMGSGTTGPGDSKTEPCPNGCGPLWPITWEQEARECWAAADSLFENLHAERDQLKVENGALRDDLEQIQYDASAWRNQDESVWIEVFHSDEDDPFISAITGQITIEQLALIQAQIVEYREDYFEKGSGLYVFRCAHYQAHYDNVGMTEPAHWETDFESYSAFPWAEESAPLDQGEQA